MAYGGLILRSLLCCVVACGPRVGTGAVEAAPDLHATTRSESPSPVTSMTFDGSGWFASGGPLAGPGSPELVAIWADGTGASRGSGVLLSWYGDGHPRVGVYTMRPAEDVPFERRKGFSAVYWIFRDTQESFASVEGTVTLATVEPDRLVGTFEFSSQRYCFRSSDGTWGEGTCDPTRIEPPTAPRGQITGSFVVVRKSLEGRSKAAKAALMDS